MTNSPVELVLTCGSWQEAQRIVDALLGAKLIACAEMLDIKSKFSWKGKHDSSDEIKLIMLSIESYFDKIEKIVTDLHSYETFVLKAMPVTHISRDAGLWLQNATGTIDQ